MTHFGEWARALCTSSKGIVDYSQLLNIEAMSLAVKCFIVETLESHKQFELKRMQDGLWYCKVTDSANTTQCAREKPGDAVSAVMRAVSL